MFELKQIKTQAAQHNMELKPITDINAWYADELSQAFPRNELKSLENIKALIADRRYELLGLYDGGTLAGYATLWMEPSDTSCILLDYLGVAASRRNGGLGGELLRRLIDRYKSRSVILAEAEAPLPGDCAAENALRVRRMGFYGRNGFAPVYEMATCGMRFQTYLGGELPTDLAPVMALHKTIYGADRVDVVVPLLPHQTPPPSLFG